MGERSRENKIGSERHPELGEIPQEGTSRVHRQGTETLED
jgi:hypothetical protein